MKYEHKCPNLVARWIIFIETELYSHCFELLSDWLSVAQQPIRAQLISIAVYSLGSQILYYFKHNASTHNIVFDLPTRMTANRL